MNSENGGKQESWEQKGGVNQEQINRRAKAAGGGRKEWERKWEQLLVFGSWLVTMAGQGFLLKSFFSPNKRKFWKTKQKQEQWSFPFSSSHFKSKSEFSSRLFPNFLGCLFLSFFFNWKATWSKQISICRHRVPLSLEGAVGWAWNGHCTAVLGWRQKHVHVWGSSLSGT